MLETFTSPTEDIVPPVATRLAPLMIPSQAPEETIVRFDIGIVSVAPVVNRFSVLIFDENTTHVTVAPLI